MTRKPSIAELRALGPAPDTRLGQHFLLDANLLRVAVRLAELGADDVALEVGPGLGVLTVELAEACRHVHAVELDERLATPLRHVADLYPNVELRFADALALPPGALEPPPTAFVANLPYNVATPLLVESLAGLPTVERWSVMVQREVADRLFAAPSTPAYGAVSVLLQLATERTGFHPVPRHVFAPPPNVDSALVAFRRREGWDGLAGRFRTVQRLVHAAFAHRRKTLANSLALAGAASRAEAEAALLALGLPAAVRAQELPPATLLALADRLAGAPEAVAS